MRSWTMDWARMLCLALLLTLVGACSRTPEAQRIREAIGAMQTAVEARDPKAFLEHISSDFTGNDGSTDREGLHNVLRAAVIRNEKIGVTIGPIDVEAKDERATAGFTVTLTGSAGGMIPERGAIYSVSSGWKREGGEWRCINAKWEQKL